MPTYIQTKRYIESLADLPIGWHYGQGVAPSGDFIQHASLLLDHADSLGFDRFNAFPGIDGELQLTIYDGANFYALTIEPDSGITVLHRQNREEIFYQENLNFMSTLIKLEDFAFEICHTLDTFTQSTLTPKAVVSATLPSKTVGLNQDKQRDVFPYLTPTAQLKRAAQYVAISKNTIPLLTPESPSSIGLFHHQTLSLLIVAGSRKLVPLATPVITT